MANGTRTAALTGLGVIGAIVALGSFWSAGRSPEVVPLAPLPLKSSGLDEAPEEVRAFLGRVLESLPEGGAGVTGYRFQHWKVADKPTHEAVGLKAVPGVGPEAVIARVMDVDHYPENVPHVKACEARRDPAYVRPAKVRFTQVVGVPGVAKVQQELVLVDAGTLRGYRVAYWYLLKPETNALDPKAGARSEFSVGAWLAAPGVVGYALSSWPRREDVNALQWASLTSGADVLARKVIEGNIDSLAGWAAKPDRQQGSPKP